MPTSKRADLSKVLRAVRCNARKRNGEPCKAMAARGANVCRVHGGSAPQVNAAAQRRLQQAADALTARLLGFAIDQGAPDAVALQAVRDALDRAGLNPKTAVEQLSCLGQPECFRHAHGAVVHGCPLRGCDGDVDRVSAPM